MYSERNKQMTFYDEPLYSQTVPSSHMLRKVIAVVDFSFVNELCKDLYCPDNGRPAWEPQILFKALFLQYLYNVSDYEIEEEINDRMSFKWFLRLSADAKGPDHSSLSVFRSRLGPERFKQIFNKVVEIARANNLISDKLHIVDSTDIKAKVDQSRITEEKKKSEKDDSGKPGDKGTFSTPDPDAQFGRKSKNHKFYGFKEHLCMDAESEIVLGAQTTPGNEADYPFLEELIPSENLPNVVTADKGYDEQGNHKFLSKNNIRNGIILRKNHTKKYIYPQRKSNIAKNYRAHIEHKNAELKRWHSLNMARYWGLARVTIQSYLSIIAVNCKRIVKLMFSMTGPPKLLLRRA